MSSSVFPNWGEVAPEVAAGEVGGPEREGAAGAEEGLDARVGESHPGDAGARPRNTSPSHLDGKSGPQRPVDQRLRLTLRAMPARLVGYRSRAPEGAGICQHYRCKCG